MNTMYGHILRSSSLFSSVFGSFDPACILKIFIFKYLIIFDTITNGTTFWNLIPICSLLVYYFWTHFSMLTLYSLALLYSFINSKNYCRFLGFSTHTIMSVEDRNSFFPFQYIRILFHFPALSRNSSMMFNKSGENGNPCLVSKGCVFNLLP